MSTNKEDLRFLNTHAKLKQFSYDYYHNGGESIEDPIFTGFTLNIDKSHSPLFFALCGDKYLETLRSPEGTNSKLSNSIEEALKNLNDVVIPGTPDSYEINTIEAKSLFGTRNKRKPGYGLWDKHNIDNVLYGAADYIYMVDKIVDGTYNDNIGDVSDLGNGTPNSSIYEEYSNELNKYNDIGTTYILFEYAKDEIWNSQIEKYEKLLNLLKENPESPVNLVGYASKELEDDSKVEYNMDLSNRRVETVKNYLITNGVDKSRITTDYKGESTQFSKLDDNRVVICSGCSQKEAIEHKINKTKEGITQKQKDDHENKAKELYGEGGTKDNPTSNSLYGKYKNATSDDSPYKTILKNLDEEIAKTDSQKVAVKTELQNYKNAMEKYQGILKSNGDKEETRRNIEETYTKFVNFVDNLETNYSNVKVSISIVRETDDAKFEKELNELKDYEKSADQSWYKKIWAVTKTAINEVKSSDSANNLIKEYKEKKEKLEKEIYGVHPDGRLGSESDPAPGSLCYNYNKAKEEYENDEYSQTENEINELKDIQANIDTISNYQQEQSKKNTVSRNIPTTDVVTESNNSNPIYEVPQTVYDMMGFIKDMDKIIYEHPYVFQSITGLDEAYKNYFEVKDPYMGSGDNKISIECLEFLDMRVSAMFNKYLNAVYDRQYRRERVPINLRRFNCSIFVHDIRNFKNTIETEDVNKSGDLSLITEIAINCVSAVEFKFFDCEIVPGETGSIFESVSNNSAGDMRRTNFTFTYGNCVINFLPFEDLRRYVLNNKSVKEIKPSQVKEEYDKNEFKEEKLNVIGNPIINNKKSTSVGSITGENVDDRNFRRWFDKSELGNVNNNDYRDYIRHDSSVAVDDHYKTTIVNNFALGSVAQKNKELTEMDDALRKIVTGIAASTGIPTEGVVDALNIGFIKPILTQEDKDVPIIKEIGNVTNSKIIDTETTEYIGTTIPEDKKEPETITNLGNVNDKKGGE